MSAPDAEIIVGVDGSEQSLGALHWAAREARRRSAPLHVVTAYTVPMIGGSTFDVGYAAFDDAAMSRAVEELVADARRRVAELDVEVRSTVQAGDPSGVLVDLSRDAQLLVLGSRGHGGFLGRLLGSVSTAVPAHAHCPVGIIPLQWGTDYRVSENVSRRPAFVWSATCMNSFQRWCEPAPRATCRRRCSAIPRSSGAASLRSRSAIRLASSRP